MTLETVSRVCSLGGSVKLFSSPSRLFINMVLLLPLYGALWLIHAKVQSTGLSIGLYALVVFAAMVITAACQKEP